MCLVFCGMGRLVFVMMIRLVWLVLLIIWDSVGLIVVGVLCIGVFVFVGLVGCCGYCGVFV